MALLVGAGRSGQVFRDVQSRLLAVAKMDGLTINGVMYGPRDLCPTEEDGVALPPLVTSGRLFDCIQWSIRRAKNSDQILRHRLLRVADWVEDWSAHVDPNTILGRVSRAKLRLEWKVRTTLGLDLPVPSC